MSKRALFDELGRPTAFYDLGLHGDAIPAEAVEISDEAWLELLAHPGERVWDGAQVVERPGAAARRATERRAVLRMALEEAYQARLAEGASVQGKTISLDEASQQRLTATYSLAQDSKAGGPAWPPSFAWRTADNSYLALPDPDAAIAFCRAMAGEAVRLRFVLFNRKDALESTPDEELGGFDPNTGWASP